MEGSDVSIQSSSTAKTRPLMPKGTDENDERFQDMDASVKNKKKPTTAVAKRNKSTAVSAASKLNSPRRKVLAERIAPSDSRTLELYERGKKSLDGEDSKWSSSKPYDPLNNYLSPRPKFLRYDPSRRHEILHRLEDNVQYGTDEMTASSGSEESEMGSSSEGGISSHFQEGDVKEGGEEINEIDDEEFEEVEKGWGFRGLLKFLSLLLGLVLYVSYISPMNSPTPSLVEQSALMVKNGSLMVQEHVNGFVKTYERGSYLLDVRDARETESDDINQFEAENVDSSELDEVEKMPSDETEGLNIAAEEELGGVDELGEVGISEVKETGEHEEKGFVDMVEVNEKARADFLELEMQKAHQEMPGEAASNLDETDQEMPTTEDQIVFETQLLVDEVDDHIMASGNTDSSHTENEVQTQVEDYPNGIELPMEKTEEAVVDVVGVNMVQEIDGGEVIETQDTFEKTEEAVVDVVGVNMVQEIEGGEVIETQDMFEVYDNKGAVPCDSEKVNEIATEAVKKESVDSEIGYVSDDYVVVNDEAEEKAVEWLMELVDGSTRYKEVLGFSILSLVMASSFVLFFHFKRRKNLRNDTSFEPCDVSLRKEKFSSKISEEEAKRIDRFVSCESSKPLIVSLEEDFEMNCPSRAPTVELLSELEVGEMSSPPRHCGMRSRMIQSEVDSHSVSMDKAIGEKAHTTPVVREMSSPPRHCGMRSRMIQSEVDSHSVSMDKAIGEKAHTTPVVRPSSSLRSCGVRNRMVESEVSSHSVSLKKGVGKKAPITPAVRPVFSMDKRTSIKVHSEPIQVQPALSGNSATDSPSYGTFISEKKIVAKQEGSNGEGTEIITPVRRSSRIRNRTTMS